MANLSGDAKQTYVADLFARIAGRYDLMNSLMTGGMHHGWKRVTARLTADGLTGSALDVATGTGDLAYALSRRDGIEHSVGIDLLPEMIVLAQGKKAAAADSDRVAFLVGDALSLPFPDGAFACATAGFSLRNMPDLPQAISEMARVVRPGGRVTTLELTPMAPGIKTSLFRLYFHGVVPLIGQLVTGDRTAYTYLPQSVDYFLQADRLAGLFAQVGLENVGYRKLGFGSVAIHYGTKPLG
ncbi:MAG: ubiquinone/menaquinone biosynthesis methyltransferase [Chloroflexi bacterium]|nr:ubiquinone/menaquinone biosynthesis methyltransferase [Chloroflexota bacterium]